MAQLLKYTMSTEVDPDINDEHEQSMDDVQNNSTRSGGSSFTIRPRQGFWKTVGRRIAACVPSAIGHMFANGSIHTHIRTLTPEEQNEIAQADARRADFAKVDAMKKNIDDKKQQVQKEIDKLLKNHPRVRTTYSSGVEFGVEALPSEHRRDSVDWTNGMVPMSLLTHP